jgi:uncharacterized protein DUF6817
MQIAQTNLQLYNQLRADGRSDDELALVRRCYELSVILYANAFQADGKPFVAHTIGVASIVAHAGLPAAIIGAGCVHNVYGNADFGDGLDETATPRRRSFVRDAVGEEVEECIYRFRSLRLTHESIAGIEANLDNLDARDRDLITMDIADHLEKYADFGLLYYSDNAWVTDAIDTYGNSLMDIARHLGHHVLADALKEAVESTRSQTIPAGLKRSDHRQWLEFVTPLSCIKRDFH